MKTKVTLSILLLLLVTSNGLSQINGLEHLLNNDDIVQITIPKSLIKLAPSVTNSIELNGMDISALTQKLDQIDVILSKQDSARRMIRREITLFLQASPSYKPLLHTQEGHTRISLHGQQEDEFITSLLIFADDPSATILVRLLGRFTADDINRLTNRGQR